MVKDGVAKNNIENKQQTVMNKQQMVMNILRDRQANIMYWASSNGNLWKVLDETLQALADHKQSFEVASKGVSAFLQPLLFFFLASIAAKLKLPFLVPIFLSMQLSSSLWRKTFWLMFFTG